MQVNFNKIMKFVNSPGYHNKKQHIFLLIVNIQARRWYSIEWIHRDISKCLCWKCSPIGRRFNHSNVEYDQSSYNLACKARFSHPFIFSFTQPTNLLTTKIASNVVKIRHTHILFASNQ